MHTAHAAAATPADRLDDHRITDRAGDLTYRRWVLRQRGVWPGDAWHPGRQHCPLGRDLVAHGADDNGRRSDKRDPRRLHSRREFSILRQETIAGMDCLGTGGLGGKQDGRLVEVAAGRGGRADAHRLIGVSHEACVTIGDRMRGDRPDAQGTASALDPNGDFPRLAISRLLNIRTVSAPAECPSRPPDPSDQDCVHTTRLLRAYAVKHLHRLDGAELLARFDLIAHGDERGAPGRGLR